MKTRQIIGGAIAAIGLLLAIGTMNDSNYEMALRFGGIVLIALGAYVAKAFDFQKEEPTDVDAECNEED